LDELHQRLAERSQQVPKRNRPAIFRPRLAVHPDTKLAAAGEWNPGDLDFEFFIPLKIFDRNSNVRFPKYMVAIGLQKSAVHDPMRGASYIKS
jgi:hypothetical protein